MTSMPTEWRVSATAYVLLAAAGCRALVAEFRQADAATIIGVAAIWSVALAACVHPRAMPRPVTFIWSLAILTAGFGLPLLFI